MLPIPLNILVEIIAFIVSVFCYTAIKNKPMIWFIPFLLFIVIIEHTGMYIQEELHKVNSWLYNISIPVEFFFYSYLFKSYFRDKRFKKIAMACQWFIPVFAIGNAVFSQGFYNFNTHTLVAGNVVMIMLCCLYFVDLFKKEEETVLRKDPMFWISTGLLFFNLGELPYTIFMDYLIAHRHDQRAMLFISLNSNLIYILYAAISIGLLCTRTTLWKTISK